MSSAVEATETAEIGATDMIAATEAETVATEGIEAIVRNGPSDPPRKLPRLRQQLLLLKHLQLLLKQLNRRFGEGVGAERHRPLLLFGVFGSSGL